MGERLGINQWMQDAGLELMTTTSDIPALLDRMAQALASRVVFFSVCETAEHPVVLVAK